MRIQREGAQLQIRGTWSAGPGDDQARFLADLRALRDSAAIGFDELAARAHYPSDVLKEAENGPSLPGLPILTAYVRACDGDVPDWEERWRRLNPDVPDDPDLPVRPAGASPAAQAGAAQASASRRPTSTTRSGSRPRSGVAARVRSTAAEEPAIPVSWPRRRHRAAPAWTARIRGWPSSRARAGTAGVPRLPARAGIRRPTPVSRQPTGTIRPLSATAGRSTRRSPACPRPPNPLPNPLRPRSSPGCRTASPSPGPRAATVTSGGRGRPATSDPRNRLAAATDGRATPRPPGPGTRTPTSPSGSCGIRPKAWRPRIRRTSGASRSRRLRPICAYRPRRRGPRSRRSRGPRGRPPPTPLPRSRNPRTGPPPPRPSR